MREATDGYGEKNCQSRLQVPAEREEHSENRSRGPGGQRRAVVGQFEKKHPSGANSPHSFCSMCGTAKVVPFQNSFKLTYYPAGGWVGVCGGAGGGGGWGGLSRGGGEKVRVSG